MINILLADDHHVVRSGIRMLLEYDRNLRIVDEAIDGNQVLEILNRNIDIDIVLTDIDMPKVDGIALAAALKASNSKTKVVILSMHDDDQHVYKAFRAGAVAYLLKSIRLEELMFALQYVHSGGRYLCAALSIKMLESNMEQSSLLPIPTDLDMDVSSREMQILHLIAGGLTNQEISNKLFLSKRTIEGHRQSLIDKFQVRNTAELVRSAMRSGIIQ